MASAVIVDDEPNLARHLERLLKKLWPELTIVGTGNSGSAALELVAAHQPDVLFLDIRMPAPDGISVARTLAEQPDRMPHIVFTTAFDEYAVAAFEAAALDYLLKPIASSRLEQTVARLQQQLTLPAQNDGAHSVAALLAQLQGSVATAKTPAEHLSWLRTGQGDTTELVAVADVVYFKSEHKYTSVFTEHREHVLRTSLKELAEQLDPNQFWQIHRSLIVNANDIVSARRDLRGRYTLTLRRRTEALRSSQAYGHRFKQM